MVAASGYFSSDDGSHEKAEATLLWYQLARESARKFGKPADLAPFWKDRMEKTGFVDVAETVLKVGFFMFICRCRASSGSSHVALA